LGGGSVATFANFLNQSAIN
jgi:hypothetical protein